MVVPSPPAPGWTARPAGWWLDPGRPPAHHDAAARPSGRRCRPPTHVHGARGDELLHGRAGEVGKLRRGELVEPLAAVRRFEAALLRDGRRRPLLPIALALLARRPSARRHQIFDLMCPLRARITSTNARSKKFVLPRSFGSTRLS